MKEPDVSIHSGAYISTASDIGKEKFTVRLLAKVVGMMLLMYLHSCKKKKIVFFSPLKNDIPIWEANLDCNEFIIQFMFMNLNTFLPPKQSYHCKWPQNTLGKAIKISPYGFGWWLMDPPQIYQPPHFFKNVWIFSNLL